MRLATILGVKKTAVAKIKKVVILRIKREVVLKLGTATTLEAAPITKPGMRPVRIEKLLVPIIICQNHQ